MDKIFTKKKASILGLVGFIQFIIASVYTATISRSTSSFLMGYSKDRFALLVSIFVLAMFCLACSYLSFFRWDETKDFISSNNKKFFYGFIALLIGTCLFFVIVFTSPTLFGNNYDAYFDRLFPLAVSSFLFMIEVFGLYLHNRMKQITRRPENRFHITHDKPVFLITIVLFITLFVSYLTKFGLLLETRYWNMAGIPVSAQQFFLVFFFFIILYSLQTKFSQIGNFLSNRKAVIFLAFLIFITSAIIWIATPLERHFFSLAPTAPNFQPYPYSDARLHDLGALSILMGKGIFFHNYTDKPLLMVIFAICHLFAGNDYLLLQNVIAAFLALIPVIIFLVGRKFHNPIFGLFASIVIVLQQKNAIQLAAIVPSVNVKLEVTETFTLLGITLLVLVLFLWAKTKSKKYIFLAGVIVAAISLIRMNPLIYIPAICLLLLIVFWKSWKQFSKQVLVFALGFLLVFSPWVITGTNAEGVPWAAVKVIDVIKNRVKPTLEEHLSTIETDSNFQSDYFVKEREIPQILLDVEQFDVSEIERTSIFPLDQLFLETSLEDSGMETTYLYLFANHLIHNIDTLFLSLPDSLITQDISSIGQREYLQDRNSWDGVLPGKQIFLLLINFLLFSTGLFYSWKKHSWSGLIPAFCLFTYVLAISIALTSGGRYIVPVNWILYFYYLFGFVFLLDWVRSLRRMQGMVYTEEKKEQLAMGKHTWRVIVVIMITFSSLIPIANTLIPSVVSGPVIQQQENNHYQEGILFYPYYDDDLIAFNIVQGQKIRYIKIAQSDIPEPGFVLQNEEAVLLSENENDEITELMIVRDRIIIKSILSQERIN